jgi:hypothetical protein
MNWDNYSRKSRLEDLVISRRGELTMLDGAKFLSDHFDPYWGEEKPFNRTISQVYNIQSLVIDPVNMRALMAEGDAPIHLGHYRELDLGAMFAGRNGILGHTVPGYQFVDPAKARAKQEYILGFIDAFAEKMDASVERVRASIRESYTAEGALVAAILEMKRGNVEAAISLLEEGRAWLEKRLNESGKTQQPPPEYFETELFLARAWDLLGERAKAVRLYQHVAAHPGLFDRNLRRLAAAEGPYRAAQLNRVVMPFSCYIPFA